MNESYSTLRDITVTVRDERGDKLFGRFFRMRIPPGTELVGRGELYLVNHIYFPPVLVQVDYKDRESVLTRVANGTRSSSGRRVACQHTGELGQSFEGCLYCWYRYWSGIAETNGVSFER